MASGCTAETLSISSAAFFLNRNGSPGTSQTKPIRFRCFLVASFTFRHGIGSFQGSHTVLLEE
jgi:hypothetical protein